MKHNTAVVVGSLNYDMIFSVDRLPGKGETMAAQGVQFCCGGKGANQAVQCARLGLKTYMAGAVGNDHMGEILLDRLRAEDVDISHVQRCSQNSGMAVVHALSDGSVHATISRGANYVVSVQDIDHLEPLFREAGIVLLQLEIPVRVVEYAVEKVKRRGCKVILNAAPATRISRETLKLCDILMLNEVEAAFYCNQPVSKCEDAQEPVRTLAMELGNTCVFTLGRNGAIASSAGGPACFCPPCEVAVIETTGAGDSFAGGFAYATLQGMQLQDAMRFSTYCSGITVQGVGAQLSMPRLQDVKQLMKTSSKVNI